jgi:transposase InsO family protein
MVSKNELHHRLSLLELAQALGNISEACRRQGISRTQFYEYKQRYQKLGLEGLKDQPATHKQHPRKTPAAIIERVLELSLEHPGWGCIRLSDWLKSQGINISSPTVQSILIKHNMGNKNERLRKLEEKATDESWQLTEEQFALISKANPCFAERNHQLSTRPGELLAQDTIYLGFLPKTGKIYLQAVVDTFGSFAFGFIHSGKLPDCAVAVLHNDVLPFYRERGLTVSAILTNNSREYSGKANHHYELYLMLNDIEHRYTAVREPQTNSFAKRFAQTARSEFFKRTFYEKSYQNINDLQADFNAWLSYYNTERPHPGYYNQGKPPQIIITEYLQSENKV